MPNTVELIQTILAVATLGAITVPLNTRYREIELGYVIRHSEVSLVATTDGSVEGVDFVKLLGEAAIEPTKVGDPENAREDDPTGKLICLQLGPHPQFVGQERFEHLSSSISPATVSTFRQSVRIRDTAMILYTSGTTAAPKGCLLSHEALVRTGVARIQERRLSNERTVIWTPCPMFHVGAIVPLIGCIATGSTFVTSRQFDPAETLRVLESEHVNVALPLFPAFTEGLIECPEFSTTDLSALDQILTTGPRPVVERAMSAFPRAKLISGYGMTEACGVAASSAVTDSDEDRLRWDGVPFVGIEMRVIDPDAGSEVLPGLLGELLVRGYCTFNGYYKDPEATRMAIDDDGWFHTGDIGVADPMGRVSFRGRYKDMLKVGGENVAALEVETFLIDHPEIRHVEIVGVPDARLGEVVAAVIEREDGSVIQEQDVIQYCRGRIATFKVPRFVHFVHRDEWPMSATKVNKGALRERLSDELMLEAVDTNQASPARLARGA